MTKYRDQFSEVVNYISANLDTEIDVNRLCQLTHLSKYHFHRQFTSYFGLPVISLARLLRLKRAAFQLAYRSDKKIVDIAFANGYDSHEAFSRAFKKHFGQAPFDFRKQPDWTPWQSNYEPVITLRTKIMNATPDFDVALVDFPETSLAVFEHRGAPNMLGSSIQKFIAWRKESRLPPSKNRTFNLVYDDPAMTEPDTYRFDLCCSIDFDLEPNHYGVINKTIPAGKCAVVRHIGSDDTIGVIVNFLYSSWLSESCFELRDFPMFFERVSFFPEVSENEMITDIFLPIK